MTWSMHGKHLPQDRWNRPPVFEPGQTAHIDARRADEMILPGPGDGERDRT